ncbi:protein sidekick-1-like [Amphibalanus amphitrite]|uniref:protein sidekick-1-like n=1 Tax=Amphibalanus amphitrite TaxID=1232801 RepID=UPI001C90DC3C|nr:protein sidekick-1-like [Amphibalanus amphitrite]
MSWLLTVCLSASLFMAGDSELGHSHGYGVYHHHAHYSYEPIPGGNNYNTTVLEGDEAVLRCRLKEPAGRKITWLRRRDWHILSSNLQLYIQDERFQVTHPGGSDEWNMHIKPVQYSDAGSYECQVTDGEQVLSTFIHLRVKRPRALISGTRQYHMVPGSSLSINCTVIETRYPVRVVSWLKDDVPLTPAPPPLTPDADGPRLTVETHRGDVNTTSLLTLAAVGADDSGVYTCRARGAAPDSVKLFVDNADKTAAISRRNSTGSALSGRGPATWLLPVTACLLAR